MSDTMSNTETATESNRATLTEKEFCSRVGISRMTAYRLREAGKLSYCQVGDKILYLPKHLEEFLISVEKRANVESEQ